MHVIPVLDLKDGVVVLAGGGRRDCYRPIDTPLCRDPSPPRVVDSFLGVYHFETFYIADLDAIEGIAHNTRHSVGLARTHPGIEFWIDAGFATLESLRPYEAAANIRFVIGSESLRSVDDYAAMRRDPRFDRHILSLDRRDGIDLGPHDLIEQPHLWPDTVISMDLAQVGRSAGPNLDRLAELRGRRPDLDVVAAGGVRGIDDLLVLAADDVRYALVATALHDRRLTRQDLERLAGGV
jgi:phosphoribosylformimino-5-aminoimidazole carboxamide ribotide isomerase